MGGEVGRESYPSAMGRGTQSAYSKPHWQGMLCMCSSSSSIKRIGEISPSPSRRLNLTVYQGITNIISWDKLMLKTTVKSPVSWDCRIHQLHLCRGVRSPQRLSWGPGNWDCRIHQVHLSRGVRSAQWLSWGPGNWDCRIHQLHLCRGVRSPQRLSWGSGNWDCRIHQLHLSRGVRHCPMIVLDMTLGNRDSEAPVMLELWGMQKYPFIAIDITLRRVLSMDQIEVWHLNWLQTNDLY